MQKCQRCGFIGSLKKHTKEFEMCEDKNKVRLDSLSACLYGFAKDQNKSTHVMDNRGKKRLMTLRSRKLYEELFDYIEYSGLQIITVYYTFDDNRVMEECQALLYDSNTIYVVSYDLSIISKLQSWLRHLIKTDHFKNLNILKNFMIKSSDFREKHAFECNYIAEIMPVRWISHGAKSSDQISKYQITLTDILLECGFFEITDKITEMHKRNMSLLQGWILNGRRNSPEYSILLEFCQKTSLYYLIGVEYVFDDGSCIGGRGDALFTDGSILYITECKRVVGKNTGVKYDLRIQEAKDQANKYANQVWSWLHHLYKIDSSKMKAAILTDIYKAKTFQNVESQGFEYWSL